MSFAVRLSVYDATLACDEEDIMGPFGRETWETAAAQVAVAHKSVVSKRVRVSEIALKDKHSLCLNIEA